MKKRMRLIGYMMTGPNAHNYGMWRHPYSVNNVLEADRYVELARLLERGCFDAIFFADKITVPGMDDGQNDAARTGVQIGLLDPIIVCALMAYGTKNIGVGATVSTSFVHTYQLARSLATVDVLSGGRLAWNVVTSTNPSEAFNFGMPSLPEKDARYDHADEVLEACFKLWDSWEDGALVLDKKTGLYMDTKRIHRADYKGKTVSSRGPLTTPRSAQGRPVIMQAGASERGLEFAARWGEIVFTVNHDVADMVAFYRDLKARVVKHGRNPEDCVICVLCDPVIGETRKIAEEKFAYGASLISEEIGINMMTVHSKSKLSEWPASTPFKEVLAKTPIVRGPGMARVFERLLESGGGNLTFGEVARRYACSSGSPILVGTPEDIANRQREMFEAGACDGFVISPSEFPGSFETYTRAVVPILQEQGLVQTGYEGRTLRENLRL